MLVTSAILISFFSAGLGLAVFFILRSNRNMERLAATHQEVAIRRYFEKIGGTNNPKALILIPAHNEEKSIAQVIEQIRRYFPKCSILVLNDGSTDDTRNVAEGMAVNVASYPANFGDGAALQMGFKIALLSDFDIVVEFDADGQHPANEISRLIEPIARGEADVVIGSRFLEKTSYRTSILRLIGAHFYSIIVSLLIRQRITDVPSGFRAYNKKAYGILSEKLPRRNAAVALLAYLGWKGCRIREMSVNMFPRQSGSSIGLNPRRLVLYPLRCVYNILKILS